MSKQGKTAKPPPKPKKAAIERYCLELYITGMTPRSIVAIKNLRYICQEFLQGRCDISIIDIYQQPALARTQQIVAAPTLIKRSPLPLRRLVGDLSQSQRVLNGLDIAV